jgi:hypothetical protein
MKMSVETYIEDDAVTVRFRMHSQSDVDKAIAMLGSYKSLFNPEPSIIPEPGHLPSEK